MRTALAYLPRRGPLQDASPQAAIVFLGSFAVVSFVFASPLILIAAGAGVCIAGFAAGARSALAIAARYGITLGLAIVFVNAIVTDRGETILLRGWELPLLGQVNVTLESLAAGGTLALRIVVVVAVFAVYSACVDPDRVLRLLRPLARRSALTATLVSRAVPLAAADLGRLREAGRLRGPVAAPATRTVLARRLLSGALDRSVDAAATLELRGFSSGVRADPAPARRSRHDRAFLLSGALIGLAALAGWIAAAGAFETYPTIVLETGPETLVLAVALTLLAALPFALVAVRSRRVKPASTGARSAAHV
ncbi:MAG: CbiQ family ECF transporter T component [Solirubrobacterales bacterium]